MIFMSQKLMPRELGNCKRTSKCKNAVISSARQNDKVGQAVENLGTGKFGIRKIQTED